MKMARWSLGMVLLSAFLVSCRTVERTSPGGGAGEREQAPWTVSAYKAEIRKAMDFCQKWGLLDDFLRCEEELRRVEQQNAGPDEIDPEILIIFERCQSATEN